jgi:hypothetical protein
MSRNDIIAFYTLVVKSLNLNRRGAGYAEILEKESRGVQVIRRKLNHKITRGRKYLKPFVSLVPFVVKNPYLRE